MNTSPHISLIELFVLCFVSAFGSSMATLPRSVADAAQEDMWLSVALGGAFFLFTVWTITKLAAFFPQYTCIEFHQILLGPVLGQMVNMLLVIISAMVVVLDIGIFVLAAELYLFTITPPKVIAITILLLLLYAAQYGLFPILRMQQLVFSTSHLVFFLVILLGLLAIKPAHYQPFFAEGITPILKGTLPAWYSYVGPEIALALLYPYITTKKYVFKWCAASVAGIITMYTTTTLIVQGILGSKEAAKMLVPTVIAYRSVEIPDTFIERLDGYLLIFWIPILIVCLMNWFYFAIFGMERMLKLENGRPVAALLIPLMFYLIALPPDYQTSGKISQVVNMAFLALDVGIWPLLLGLAWWRKKRQLASADG